jgi:peroxin-5
MEKFGTGLNIGAYQEAAEHFLSALALHRGADPVQNPAGPKKSEQLWQTLSRTFVSMVRLLSPYERNSH